MRAWARGRGLLVALVSLFVGLLLLDALLYQVRLPVTISSDGATLTFTVGGETFSEPIRGRILSVGVPARDPLVHEFQIDDTDSTNNLTLDPAYLRSIETTPYYQLYAWMRDLDGLSRWRDLCLTSTGAAPQCVARPALSGVNIAAPLGASGASQRVTAQIQRPETPVELDLTMSDGSLISVTINRNDRFVMLTRTVARGPAEPVGKWYFPTEAAPFAAMTLDFVARVALWALALLGLLWGGEWLLGYALGALGVRLPGALAERSRVASACVATGLRGWLAARWRALTAAIHPVGLAGLLASFIYVIWIALAQYHALPHIYDAAAYLFGAKTFVSGRLWVPAPPASVAANFSGPFMVIADGRWFNQYAPGTSLTLAVGVALGVPWLVEPLLGTLALLGVGLIAHRLYGDRRVATIAVLLGAASPFYSYLAASYLSHTIALCYLVWGWWALLRWQALAETRSRASLGWLGLAAALWLLASFTRETSLIFIVVAAGGMLWLGWRRGWLAPWLADWPRLLPPVIVLLLALLLGALISLLYNAALTGDSALSPRALFFPGDHYGFGQGVGFYGMHTLAAGFVNLDQLLVSLATDLYGWPFSLTLPFLLIPFLARRAVAADVALLLSAMVMTFSFVGYFYAGIYLGPRYLYETLPFLLILTARGWLALTAVGQAARARGAALAEARGTAPRAVEVASRWAEALSLTGALALALVGCWALFYLPCQVALHTNFTGMATGSAVNFAALEHPPPHNALVVTSDSQLYGYTLFALNDPLLRGNVIYAEGDPDSYAALHRAFPTRRIYALALDIAGNVEYIPVQAG